MSRRFGLLSGRAEFADLVDRRMHALSTCFHELSHGGWFTSIDAASGAPVDDRKQAYPPCGVLLAASSAVVAGRPGADELLALARHVHEEHFWLPSKSLVQESFSADWSRSRSPTSA